jgi:hypothetical protein
MTPRLSRPAWSAPWTMWLAVALSCVAVVALVQRVRHRHVDDVLPPPVARAIDAERAARPAVDSQVTAAWAEAEAARARSDVAEASSKRLERVARTESRRADSLARVALVATSAVDSALAWRAAYDARTAERDTIRRSRDSLGTALAESRRASVAFRGGLTVADSGRHRADSVLDATAAAARHADCRVPFTLGLVRCMSRTHALEAGVALGIGATMTYDAVRDGRVRIPLLVHR